MKVKSIMIGFNLIKKHSDGGEDHARQIANETYEFMKDNLCLFLNDMNLIYLLEKKIYLLYYHNK